MWYPRSGICGLLDVSAIVIVLVLVIDDGDDDALMMLSLPFFFKFPNGYNDRVFNEWNVTKQNV